MSNKANWAHALARQADADFQAWELYQRHPESVAAECHRMLFLQMASEKLCKAYLIMGGRDPKSLQHSHGYIKGPLPLVIREEIVFLERKQGSHRSVKRLQKVVRFARQLAGEIELLNPAVKRTGQREDNCEYPWEVGGRVFSPLDQPFIPSQLLVMEGGIVFLKTLRSAINRLVESSRMAE